MHHIFGSAGTSTGKPFREMHRHRGDAGLHRDASMLYIFTMSSLQYNHYCDCAMCIAQCAICVKFEPEMHEERGCMRDDG